MRAAVGMGINLRTQGLSGAVRAVCSPLNLLVVCVLVLNWSALLAWTGTGSRGWQARLCADLDLRSPACAVVQAQHAGSRPAVPGAAS